MSEYIKEAIKQAYESYNDKEFLNIVVHIKPVIEEAVISSDIEVIPDDQTLDDWYDFAANIEGIIESFGEIDNISMSNNPNSLSEYIDFYTYDKEGNLKDYLVDLRISNHKSTSNAKKVRKKRVSRVTQKYELVSITVNDKTYNSYHEALNAVRLFLAKDLMQD